MLTKEQEYQCKVEERPIQYGLVMRRTTSVENLPQTLGETYGAIAQYLAELGEEPAGAPFIAYYNMDMQNLDVAIGFPVTRQLAGKKPIDTHEMPTGKVATCVHTGPYNQVGLAYEALSTWMAKDGYEATGIAYEYYLNDPQETPPEQLMTQILFPLK